MKKGLSHIGSQDNATLGPTAQLSCLVVFTDRAWCLSCTLHPEEITPSHAYVCIYAVCDV